MQTEESKKSSSREYLEKYQIEALFKELMVAVLTHRPEDPRQFLAAYLNTASVAPSSPGSSSDVIHEKEINEEVPVIPIVHPLARTMSRGSEPDDGVTIRRTASPATVRATSVAERFLVHHQEDELRFNRLRRGSVSGESMNPEEIEEIEPVVIPKPPHVQMRIANAFSNNMLFRNLEKDQRLGVMNAMFERVVKAGETVIFQGDEGDNFYVIEEGLFEVLVDGEKVVELCSGGSFGELALMYNTPRAATVRAVTDGILWCVDRVTFRRCVAGHNFRKRKMYESFLKTVPILSKLLPAEVTRLSDALEPVEYEEGDYIVEQGEDGTYFYIIEQGEVEVTKIDDQGNELVLPSLGPGDYFGELALMYNAPRAATVMAKTNVRVAALAKDAFVRLLGPVVTIMKRRSMSYSESDRQALETMLNSIKEESDQEDTKEQD